MGDGGCSPVLACVTVITARPFGGSNNGGLCGLRVVMAAAAAGGYFSYGPHSQSDGQKRVGERKSW